jgi:hypothetical protein
LEEEENKKKLKKEGKKQKKKENRMKKFIWLIFTNKTHQKKSSLFTTIHRNEKKIKL